LGFESLQGHKKKKPDTQSVSGFFYALASQVHLCKKKWIKKPKSLEESEGFFFVE
jgi:hypothetical protein